MDCYSICSVNSPSSLIKAASLVMLIARVDYCYNEVLLQVNNSNKIVKNKKRFSLKLSYILILILFLIVLGGGAVGYTQYTKLQDENKRLSDPQEAAKSESERIKSEVASLIEVPADEEPTIASVVDSSKLSGQAFFAKAQNGDRVIMYQKAKKAILYRPTTKKIIEVAPINIGDDAKPKTTAPAETQVPPVSPEVTEQPAFAQ